MELTNNIQTIVRKLLTKGNGYYIIGLYSE